MPLFRDHRVLSQVAGHGLHVLKGLPPLVVDEDDLDWFATALDETVARAEKMPRALVRFALTAARAGRPAPGSRLVLAALAALELVKARFVLGPGAAGVVVLAVLRVLVVPDRLPAVPGSSTIGRPGSTRV